MLLSEVSVQRLSTIEALLNAGADIEKPDFKGFTPLETSILRCFTWDMRSPWRIDLKVELSFEPTSFQRSPSLNCCAILARVTCVTLLLSHIKRSLEIISVDDDWLPS